MENVKKQLEALDLPVIAAPMFLVSGIELVVEGCKSGVVTTFPLLNARTSEELEQWMQEIIAQLAEAKESNSKVAPWGVNLVVHRSNDRYDADVELIKKYQPPIVITSLGKPTDIAKVVHEYGGLVFSDVISIKHAKKAAEAEIDGLILVCNGAGGHGGTLNPMAFVHEVKQFFDGLIILSGSISHGQDILAAQVIGADLAYMGTRFIATEESIASQAYKEMLLEAQAADIIYTDKISGVNANFIVQSVLNAGLNPNSLEKPKELEIVHKADGAKAWKDIWSAGHGVGGINEILPVSKLVEKLNAEYQDSIQKVITKQQKKVSL
ncbi:nitronate monooxygenase family protein [Rummeliibacillus sp. TYF005]|uniref:NAD(P)H-dependent flavin oxidoreductase n=1 Tax=Rummeliibacillus sp. TYF005 TaxID=2058214 RepID=UPI000F52B275|nr:nitronate monooxygenase [Rummeliibacillus sp. TYF005]RPJ95631.1 nitronate monooxygenase [Rummeliibacillus sp. TYF005]